jgi:hypothetical protein
MKTKSCVRDKKLAVTAVDGVAGKARPVAKIFAVGSTINTFAVGPAEPRNADAITDFELRSADRGVRIGAFANLFDTTDNLVPQDQRQFRIRQFAIDDVKIGPANRARTHTNE